MQAQAQQQLQTVNVDQVLTFKINDSLFCIPVDLVESVIETPEITELPQAPDYIAGSFLYRRQTLLAVQLRTLLGMPENIKPRRPSMVITILENQRIGLWIDEIKGLVDTEKCIKSDLPELALNQGVRTALIYDEQVIYPVNVAAMSRLRKELDRLEQVAHEQAKAKETVSLVETPAEMPTEPENTTGSQRASLEASDVEISAPAVEAPTASVAPHVTDAAPIDVPDTENNQPDTSQFVAPELSEAANETPITNLTDVEPVTDTAQAPDEDQSSVNAQGAEQAWWEEAYKTETESAEIVAFQPDALTEADEVHESAASSTDLESLAGMMADLMRTGSATADEAEALLDDEPDTDLDDDAWWEAAYKVVTEAADATEALSEESPLIESESALLPEPATEDDTILELAEESHDAVADAAVDELLDELVADAEQAFDETDPAIEPLDQMDQQALNDGFMEALIETESLVAPLESDDAIIDLAEEEHDADREAEIDQLLEELVADADAVAEPVIDTASDSVSHNEANSEVNSEIDSWAEIDTADSEDVDLGLLDSDAENAHAALDAEQTVFGEALYPADDYEDESDNGQGQIFESAFIAEHDAAANDYTEAGIDSAEEPFSLKTEAANTQQEITEPEADTTELKANLPMVIQAPEIGPVSFKLDAPPPTMDKANQQLAEVIQFRAKPKVPEVVEDTNKPIPYVDVRDIISHAPGAKERHIVRKIILSILAVVIGAVVIWRQLDWALKQKIIKQLPSEVRSIVSGMVTYEMRISQPVDGPDRLIIDLMDHEIRVIHTDKIDPILLTQRKNQLAKIYKVRKGDTLWKIAEEHLNDSFSYPELAMTRTINSKDLIYPGDIITIQPKLPD